MLLRDPTYRIGRMGDTDLCLPDDSVSRCHAELTRTAEGSYTIKDLNSSNGTYLNGSRISAPEEIKASDLLKVGNVLINVEEHIDSETTPRIIPDFDDPTLKLISLDDEFACAEEDYPGSLATAPAETPLSMEDTGEVLLKSAFAEEPVHQPGDLVDKDTSEGAGVVESSREEEWNDVENDGLEDLHSRIASLTTELEIALMEIRRLEADQTRSSEQAAKIDQDIEEVEKLTREIAQTLEGNTTLRSEIVALKDELAETKLQLLENDQDKADVENSTISRLEDRIAEQESTVEELRAEISQGREENAALRAEIATLEVEKAERERQLLETSRDQAHAKSCAISRLEVRIAELKSTTVALEKANETLTQSNLELRRQLDASEAEAAESSEREAELCQDKAELVAELKTAESDAAKLSARIEKANLSISKNETVIEDLKGQLRESQSKARAGKKLKTELGSAERRRIAAEEELRKIEANLASTETEAQALRQQLSSAQGSLSKLEAELARSIDARSEIESERGDLRNKLHVRERSIAELVTTTKELEAELENAREENSRLEADLRLTREGLSEALQASLQRLADARESLNIEIYLREAAEKQLREAAVALQTRRDRSEGLVLASEDTNLNRVGKLMEESDELLAFEARLRALDRPAANNPKDNSPGHGGSFLAEEFYRQLIEKLDLVDTFIELYENKWSYSKVASQFGQIKHAFIELLEKSSVSLFVPEPGTSLCGKEKLRIEPAPNEDGTLPKIDTFGNSQVVETVSPGYLLRDSSREVVLRKAKVLID